MDKNSDIFSKTSEEKMMDRNRYRKKAAEFGYMNS